MIQWYDFEPNFDTSIHRTKTKSYLKMYMCLDTETSNNHDETAPVGWIYQWALRLEDTTVVGRKPSELMSVLEKINAVVSKLEHKPKVLCFIHNASYDLEYLKYYLRDTFGQPKMLAIKQHKILTFTVGQIEFRCSYLLANRSLEKWGNDLNIVHKKKVGLIDYDKIRTQSEELTADDWAYMEYDVLSLQECIQKQMELYHDNTLTIPLTSTGYVRRQCRKHYKESVKNRKAFLQTRLNEHVYKLLLSAFAGAITHGNLHYAGELLEGNIRHRDYNSHYPTQQICKKAFPIGAYHFYGYDVELDELPDLLKANTLLVVFQFENAVLKDVRNTAIPYIMSYKVREGRLSETLEIKEDNGRVMGVQGRAELVLTEIDLKWVLKQYDFGKIRLAEVYYSKRGYLPKFLRDTVFEAYKNKSEFKHLKNVETDPVKKADYELSLMISKNMLNGIYGCTATRPLRPEVTFDYKLKEWHTREPSDYKSALDKYYMSYTHFMRFQFGCYTTALARDELLNTVEIIGYNNLIYCDTDSAFYLSTPEVEARLEEQNRKWREEAEREGYFVECSFGRSYFHSFDDEYEDIEQFKFLHAKCYGYKLRGSEDFKLVIAGVTAYEDATRQFSREQELGNLERLETGFTFERCGGTKAKYTDIEPTTMKYNGEMLEVSSACIITKTTKKLRSELETLEEFILWEEGVNIYE